MDLKCARRIEVCFVVHFKLKHSKHSMLMILQDPCEVNLIYAELQIEYERLEQKLILAFEHSVQRSVDEQ